VSSADDVSAVGTAPWGGGVRWCRRERPRGACTTLWI